MEGFLAGFSERISSVVKNIHPSVPEVHLWSVFHLAAFYIVCGQHYWEIPAAPSRNVISELMH